MAKKVKKPVGTHPALLKWLNDNLGRGEGQRSMAGLADVLGIHPSQVTRMMTNLRRIQLYELPKIATYLGKPIPSEAIPNNHKKSPAETSTLGNEETVPSKVRVEAIVAPSVWREVGGNSMAYAERIPPSHDPRLAGMRQYACKIEADNRYAICVPFEELRGSRPRQGDIIHVRRVRGTVYEDTLRTARVVKGKTELHLANGGPQKERGPALMYPSAAGDEDQIELRGLVVGYFTPAAF